MIVVFKLKFFGLYTVEAVEVASKDDKTVTFPNGYRVPTSGTDYRFFDTIEEANSCRVSTINSQIDKLTKEINSLEEALNTSYLYKPAFVFTEE